jgi:aspartyl-tRNA(Asn)/glutamyl-tRNA(Gln) amidotransferase subunit A
MPVEKGLMETASLLEKGDLSAVDVARAFSERIENQDPEINAYITHDRETLLKEAEASDRRRKEGSPLSPLDGVPVAVKDNINTSGVPTTCGSKILSQFVPPFDATAYARMKEKGILLLGKTNMDEFAMGSSTESSYFGPTRNPHDRERVPGGSSGGSAAAVAARMAPAALGSDTGGSIRQPASFCGVVGVKPTYGRVSRYGLVAFASSLDQIGTFAGNVRDATELLSVISGYDNRDSTSIDRPVDYHQADLSGNVKGMVLGLPEEYFSGVDGEITGAIRDTVARLEAEGARVEPISLKYMEYAIPVYYLIATAEASSNLARFDGVRYGYRSPETVDLESLYFRSRSEGFGSEVKRRIILGTFSLSSGYYDAYYLQALKGRSLIIEDFRQAFDKVDAIVTPVTTTPAFVLGEMSQDPLQMYMSDILTISANLAGIPGISVPLGKNRDGLPFGVQIMGDHFEEKKMLTCAAAFERAAGIAAPAL